METGYRTVAEQPSSSKQTCDHRVMAEAFTDVLVDEDIFSLSIVTLMSLIFV